MRKEKSLTEKIKCHYPIPPGSSPHQRRSASPPYFFLEQRARLLAPSQKLTVVKKMGYLKLSSEKTYLLYRMTETEHA